MYKDVNIEEAQKNLPELVLLALAGDEIVISENNKPVARIVPVSRGERIAGLNQGSIIAGDDFDEPIPDEFWSEPI